MSYHEVREQSDGDAMCPLPWNNTLYLINCKTWTCRECGIEYAPSEERVDAWTHEVYCEMTIPFDGSPAYSISEDGSPIYYEKSEKSSHLTVVPD